MKSINIICKVEVYSKFDDVVTNLNEYISKNPNYDYTVYICCPTENENISTVPENFKIEYCKEGQILEELVNDLICSSEADYTICTALNDNNWQHKLDKIIFNLSSGVDVCRISKMVMSKNIFVLMFNFLIKLYYSFLNFFTYSEKNLNATDINFQGFSKYAIFLMKNQKYAIFNFRYTDGFLLINQKILYLKNEKKSPVIEHITSQKMTKTQIASIGVLGFGILIVILSFPLLLKLYLEKGALFKFIVFDLLIFASCFVFFINYYFGEEIKKYGIQKDKNNKK